MLLLMASTCLRGTYITDDTDETDFHTAEQSDVFLNRIYQNSRIYLVHVQCKLKDEKQYPF